MTAANPAHALALVLADELARLGVTDAVLAPGSRSTALAMAFHDEPRIRLHVEVDERSAAFLALGLGRVQGRPVPVITTSGSAVANLHPAVVEADTGRVPLLLLTADRPPELRNTAANQAIDQLGIFGRAARWFCEVGTPEDVPGAVAYWRSTAGRAYAEAVGTSSPAGPVHLNLAFREPTVPASDDGRTSARPFEQPLEGRPAGRPWVSVDRAPRVVDDADLAGFAGRIASTERGAIVVGQTTADPGPIHALAAATGWPVIAEPTSRARHGEHAIATASHLLRHRPFAEAHRPAFVLRVGRTGLSRGLSAWLGPEVPQLLVDPDGAWLDPERSVADIVAADVGRFCASLVRHLAVDTSSDWLERWRDADLVAAKAVAEVLDATEQPTEPRTARDVAAAVPDHGRLVVGSSMPVRDLDLFMAPRDLDVVANRGASGIDGFVSTALGVALADGRPTVALCGDLTLLHDSSGFLLNPDAERVDAVFVVVDNDGGGIFHFLPQAGYPSFERLFGTPHGRDLSALASLHGLAYAEVAVASRLGDEVSSRADVGGLHLVHVRTDRRDNLELHRRITEAVGAALDA